MSEVSDFCTKHGAVCEGRKWALQYQTLAEAYDNCPRGDWLWWGVCAGGFADSLTRAKVQLACAEHILQAFEARFPNDRHHRNKLEEAKRLITHPSDAGCILACISAHDVFHAILADNADIVDAVAESQWQADKIREILGRNPFQKGA
jgi:hypothetical protein